MSKTPISQRLKDFLGFNDEDTNEEINKLLKERLSIVCKPCWELKYCPYGPLVEDFPLPPLTVEHNKNHNEYLRNYLETGLMGEGKNKKPLDKQRRKLFEESLKNPPDELVEKISFFETEASCKEFGHLCPAFFVSEPFTETKDGRRMTRSLLNATIIRVVRRDNNTCQICGKILLDKEIEFDHIIPFSKGGHSDESNLRVSCFECNNRKSDKLDILRD